MKNNLMQFLSEKEEKFLNYEEITKAMLTADPDGIESASNERDRLIGVIDRLDIKLRDCCEGDEALMAVLRCEGDRSTMTGELAEIYDKAHSIRFTASRVAEIEPLVLDHVKFEREVLLKKITENNKSQGAAVSKIYEASHFDSAEEEYRQINTKA